MGRIRIIIVLASISLLLSYTINAEEKNYCDDLNFFVKEATLCAT